MSYFEFTWSVILSYDLREEEKLELRKPEYYFYLMMVHSQHDFFSSYQFGL